MQSLTDNPPTFFGFVATSDDARMLIQACEQGVLRVLSRRPTSSEKPSLARSGHVFIYEGTTSSIQRWTDGRRWSPSRVLGDFLIYGEREATPRSSEIDDAADQLWGSQGIVKDPCWQILAHLVRSFHLHSEQLVKKSISIPIANSIWHVVSYFRPVDALQNRLPRPCWHQLFILQSWYLRPGSVPLQADLEPDRTAACDTLTSYGPASSAISDELQAPSAWSMSILSTPHQPFHNYHGSGLFRNPGTFDHSGTFWSGDDHSNSNQHRKQSDASRPQLDRSMLQICP
jgi:hypothetical protein